MFALHSAPVFRAARTGTVRRVAARVLNRRTGREDGWQDEAPERKRGAYLQPPVKDPSGRRQRPNPA
jgi:hypothetical protein